MYQKKYMCPQYSSESVIPAFLNEPQQITSAEKNRIGLASSELVLSQDLKVVYTSTQWQSGGRMGITRKMCLKVKLSKRIFSIFIFAPIVTCAVQQSPPRVRIVVLVIHLSQFTSISIILTYFEKSFEYSNAEEFRATCVYVLAGLCIALHSGQSNYVTTWLAESKQSTQLFLSLLPFHDIIQRYFK